MGPRFVLALYKSLLLLLSQRLHAVRPDTRILQYYEYNVQGYEALRLGLLSSLERLIKYRINPILR